MSGGSWWYISHELQFMVLPTGTLLLMTFPTKKCLTHSSNEDKYFTLLSFFSIWVTCSPSSKNWSNILFFLLQLFCFHWELREHILHFHGELELIRWNHDSLWGKCCQFWARLLKINIEDTALESIFTIVASQLRVQNQRQLQCFLCTTSQFKAPVSSGYFQKGLEQLGHAFKLKHAWEGWCCRGC